jgi:hypothetical protein
MPLSTSIRNVIWPELEDEQSVALAVQRAAKLVYGWSILLIAIGLLDLVVTLFLMAKKPSGTSVATDFVWFTLGAGLFFALIAWRISRNSLGWAIAGLAICALGAFAVLPSVLGFLIYVFIVLIFVSAVRATYKFRRNRSEGVAQSA